MPPRAVGRFRIERTLGVGTFATVLLGVDDATGERYALKVMRKDTLEALDMARYARREAFVLRRLAHPNIVALVEAVQSDRKLFLVMPVAPGGELLAAVEGGALAEAEARRYARQLVDAVGYMHRKGVAHRDLKPENVMVDTATGSLTLVDFGLTGIVLPDARMTTVCGSAFYSAPEVTYGSGEGYSGPAADAWSVGVLVYILLTGTHPWVAADGELMVPAMRAGELRVPDSVAPNAAHFLTGLLAVDPASRYSMAKAARHPWLAVPRSEDDDAAETSAEASPDLKQSPMSETGVDRTSFRYDSSSRMLSFKSCKPVKVPTPEEATSFMYSDESARVRRGAAAGEARHPAPRRIPSGPELPAPAAPRFSPKRPGTFSGASLHRNSLGFTRVGSEVSEGQGRRASLRPRAAEKDPAVGVGSSSFFRFRRSSAAAAPGRDEEPDGREEPARRRTGLGRSRRSVDKEAPSLHYPEPERAWHGILANWRTRRLPADRGKT